MNLSKHLLEQYGEFFPFAYDIDTTGDLQQVATYFEEEHPSVDLVFEHLVKALKETHTQHHFLFASICRNVYYTPVDRQKQEEP